MLIQLFTGFLAWILHRGELLPVFYLLSTMGNASSVQPKAESPDLKSDDAEKPEDTDSSPTAITAQDNTTQATDAKAPEVSPSKVAASSLKQVTINTTQGNIPRISEPKAAEALPPKVPLSSLKQDLPSKFSSIEAADDQTAEDSPEPHGTETDPQESPVPADEKKKGPRKSVHFSSSLNRLWTSIKNFKGSRRNRLRNSVSTDTLGTVESESGLSSDSGTQVTLKTVVLFGLGQI